MGPKHRIVNKIEKPLVLYAKGGFFSTNYQYLVSYKGFAFFTKSSEPIMLTTGVETIAAKKIGYRGNRLTRQPNNTDLHRYHVLEETEHLRWRQKGVDGGRLCTKSTV